jgi:hypothetical protein
MGLVGYVNDASNLFYFVTHSSVFTLKFAISSK